MTSSHMEQIYAVIHITGSNDKLSFTDLEDLKRILREDKYEHKHTVGAVEIWTPTKERLVGELTFTYVIDRDKSLRKGTIFYH